MNPTPDPSTAYRLLADNVQRVIQGKPEVVRLAVVAMFAEGHLLIEDVRVWAAPGQQLLRDQPWHADDAVGAAGGDGGAKGHCRQF